MPESEEIRAKTEEVASTPEVGGAVSTQPEQEPTLKYGEEDFQRAVSKGLESYNRQLELRKAEADRAKAEVEVNKATLAQLKEEMKERDTEIDRLVAAQFADDPEAFKGYKQTKAIELRERQNRLKEAELAVREAEQNERAFKIVKAELATELQKERKVPNKVLQLCTSEEQMRSIAETFPKVEEELPKEEKLPKFDSGKQSGGSRGLTKEDVKNMSPEEQNRRTKEIALIPF